MFCIVTVSLLLNSNIYLYRITLSYFVINLSLVVSWWLGSLLCVTLIIIIIIIKIITVVCNHNVLVKHDNHPRSQDNIPSTQQQAR